MKKLFYFACRHHILELVGRAVWESAFEKSNRPENEMFKYLKDTWPSLDKGSYDVLDIEKLSPWLQERRVAALQDLRSILQRAPEFLPRDDYRELAELSMLVLGETPPRGVHISIPRALHNARFMARMIYSTKMYLFRAQLMYQEETVNLLEKKNQT